MADGSFHGWEDIEGAEADQNNLSQNLSNRRDLMLENFKEVCGYGGSLFGESNDISAMCETGYDRLHPQDGPQHAGCRFRYVYVQTAFEPPNRRRRSRW